MTQTIENLKAENEALKSENEQLKAENEQYKELIGELQKTKKVDKFREAKITR